MKRTTLKYYQTFAGWKPNAGSIQVAMNDFKTLPYDQRKFFCTVLQSAVENNRLADIDVAGQFIDNLVDLSL